MRLGNHSLFFVVVEKTSLQMSGWREMCVWASSGCVVVVEVSGGLYEPRWDSILSLQGVG